MSVPHLIRIHALALILTTLTLPTAVAQIFDHGSNCNQHGGAGNLDKKTRITTNCDDEGHFSGYSTLMVLWPGDTYNIVRRYAPEIDLDGNGTADGKDNIGYPNLVHRIYLTSQWSSQNGANGFPLNLKRESNFKQFIAHLENNGTGRQCIFDTDGCNECIQYELDEHGEETNVCETWELVTDQAIPMGEHCPSSFYAGKVCGPGGGSPKNACTDWKGRWKPSKSGVCANITLTQTRFYQAVDSTGRRCDISQGLPGIPKPADDGDTRVVAGDRPGCPDCPDNNHDGNPDWETTWRDLRSQDYECQDSEWFRYCQHDHTKKQEHPGGPHKGTKLDVWTPATPGQTINQLCPDQNFVEINTCGNERRTPGTKNCAVDGQCDNTVSKGCNPGTPIGYIASTDTWSCQGLHGGTTTTGCGPVPKQGVCDNDNQNQCLVGTPIDQQPDGTWKCDGLHGGPDSDIPRCKKKRPGTPLTPQCGINCPTGSVLPRQHPLMHWQTNHAGRCRLVDSGIGLANYAPRRYPVPGISMRRHSQHLHNRNPRATIHRHNRPMALCRRRSGHGRGKRCGMFNNATQPVQHTMQRPNAIRLYRGRQKLRTGL